MKIQKQDLRNVLGQAEDAIMVTHPHSQPLLKGGYRPVVIGIKKSAEHLREISSTATL
jgi:hypothetical protein